MSEAEIREAKEERTLADDVRDGTYYKNARKWYSNIYHLPIAERSYYFIIIFLAFLNAYFAINSLAGVFPIKPGIPFVVYSKDIAEDLPRITNLTENEYQDKNIAVMKFMLKTYVLNREAYDLKNYELRYRNIWSQSSNEVFEEYKTSVDPNYIYSPYRLYSNKQKRDIEIVSIEYNLDIVPSFAKIVFRDSIIDIATGKQRSKRKWEADVAFKYSSFSVEQKLDPSVWIVRFLGLTDITEQYSGDKNSRTVIPMKFEVKSYSVKELLE